MIARFRDRTEAGQRLAQCLTHYANQPDALVLALPRGGVPVGYEVAQALNVPLDVFIVRKLGVPQQEELAMGAIASGGVRVLNRNVLVELKIPNAVIDAVAARERCELEQALARPATIGAYPRRRPFRSAASRMEEVTNLNQDLTPSP